MIPMVPLNYGVGCVIFHSQRVNIQSLALEPSQVHSL